MSQIFLQRKDVTFSDLFSLSALLKEYEKFQLYIKTSDLNFGQNLKKFSLKVPAVLNEKFFE